MNPILSRLLLACCATVALPVAAFALVNEEVAACRADVVHQATQYAADALDAVQDCMVGRAKGSLPPASDCSTPDAAAAATDAELGATAFVSDPGASACAAVTPAAALYTSCPVPCEAMATTDWTAVGDCMKCAIDAEVASHIADIAGDAPAPATRDDRNCIAAMTSSSSRITRLVLRANDRCQQNSESIPQECERLDARSRAKLRKTLNKGAQNIARKCAAANLAGIGACATSLSDAGCVQNAAQRHSASLVTIASRLLQAAPASPSAQFTSVHESAGGAPCAIRSDGTAACWGWSYTSTSLAVPGRFSDLSGGCWLRDDGTLDCRGLESVWYELPPPGPYTGVDAYWNSSWGQACALGVDGAILCIGGEATYAGPYTKFSMTSDHYCGLRPDASIHCWTSQGENAANAYDRPGSFVDVSVSWPLVCGLRTDGSLDCWNIDNTEITDPVLQPPAGVFTRVSTSYQYACALRTDGTLACWGYTWGIEEAPAGTFVDVSVSDVVACAVASDGSLACWATNYGTYPPPPQQPGAAALSSNGRCILDVSGSIACWGTWPDGPAAAPEGSFDQVSAGNDTACAIAPDQTLHCWGNDPELDGTFLQVAITDNRNLSRGCALRTDGTVDCWGTVDPTGVFIAIDVSDSSRSCGLRPDGTLACWTSGSTGSGPMPGSFTQIASGYNHLCGLRASGLVECYLDYCGYYSCNEGQASPPADTFSQIDAGGEFTCGIRTDGTIACWGAGDYGQTQAPAGTFTQLSVGLDHSCAVRTDGTVACWGYDRFGDTEPPTGTFTSVAAGGDFTCGRRTDATLECWGSPDHGVAAPHAGPWIDLDANSSSGCGIEAGGTLSCWGSENGDGSGVALPPAGTFVDVSTDLRVACGVRTDGTATCWGDPMPTPPPGTFVEVVTGAAHACGRRPDGTAVCWGDNSKKQATPPFATYLQISAGGNHSCGVRADGTLACWGESYEEQAPRGGTFTEVAAGSDVACARRTDGSVACWGRDEYSQATPPTELLEHVYAGDGYACGLRADTTSACWGSVVRR